MNNRAKIIIALLVVAAVTVGAVLVFGNKDDNNKTPSNNGSQLAEIAATIVYNNDGFSPSSVTVPSGSTVRIENHSDNPVGPSSDSHPDHDLNTELNLPDLDPGQSTTMVVTKKGTWGYHNHLKEDHRGTIIVE